MSEDLTIAYTLGVEDMRSRLHKASDEIERLRAENETLRRDVKTAIMGDSAELQDVKRENDKLRNENAEWQKMVNKFILMNDAYKEQIEFWMKEAKDQKYLHEKARELGICEGRLDEIQKQKLIQADIKSSN